MNFWCYPRVFLSDLQFGFSDFHHNWKDPLKDEFLLPAFADDMLKRGFTFDVLFSSDHWFGVTYAGESVEGYGNELWIIRDGQRAEKSISRSSVDYALQIALEGNVAGPKALKIYGSSYVYSLFQRFGLV